METVLKLSNINKSFGRKKIIDNISFEVYAGEVFGFLGPNGAGKTTTIKMVMGFLSIDAGLREEEITLRKLFALYTNEMIKISKKVSVISIAVYFVGTTANTILMQFVKGDWLKFIPFNNLNFTKKIFSGSTLSQNVNSMPGAVNNSLTFSLIYTVILLVCMVYVGLDSFNRRDIK